MNSRRSATNHGRQGLIFRGAFLAGALTLSMFPFTFLLHQQENTPLTESAPQHLLTYQKNIMRDFVRVNNSTVASQTRRSIEVPAATSRTAEGVQDQPNPGNSDSPDYYMVFSTSCTPQQNWESYVFFFHAMKVMQPGSVTRITSGCTDEEQKALEEFHQRYIAPMGDFHIHFTPDYSRVVPTDFYKYFNKPFGLLHWMRNGLGISDAATVQSPLKDAIVMLLDPDMVLLRPMTHDFTGRDIEWIISDQHPEPATKVVRHGFPMSQQDGYLDNEWMGLNLSYIVNASLPAKPNPKDGPRIWNSGPPYMATVMDMYALAKLWADYVPRVHHVYPKLYAEMFGLIIASLKLNLPFTMTPSFVVSEPAGVQREMWRYIDKLSAEDVCKPPISSVPWPLALHYCQRYNLGKWFFSKYRVKKSIMNCNQPLIAAPPLDVALKFNYRAKPPLANGADLQNYTPHQVVMDRTRVKRHGYMLCHMIRAVNEALIYFKRQGCGADANLNMTWDIYGDPSDK